MEYGDIIAEFSGAGATTTESLQAQLVRCMVNERMAPEVLPFATDVMARALLGLERQQQWLLDCHELELTDLDFKLQLMVAETEIERLNYLVRVYLRTRLAKLDRFTAFYLMDQQLVLSEDEVDYVTRHFRMLNRLYTESFLKRMPAELALLDDNKGGEQMVETPDLDQPVFFQYVGTVLVELELGGEDVLELHQGGIYVARYAAIKPYLETNDVILI